MNDKSADSGWEQGHNDTRSRHSGNKFDTKSLWTHEDFAAMAWHDVKLHAIGIVGEYPGQLELLLDIDYILEWITSDDNKESSFFVSPATLVFNEVFGLSVNLHNERLAWDIDQITREEANPVKGIRTWSWVVRLQQGRIMFSSSGYNQYIRKTPVISHGPSLSLKDRGGISFDRLV